MQQHHMGTAGEHCWGVLRRNVCQLSPQYTEHDGLTQVTEEVYAQLLGWVALWWRYPAGMAALMRVRSSKRVNRVFKDSWFC